MALEKLHCGHERSPMSCPAIYQTRPSVMKSDSTWQCYQRLEGLLLIHNLQPPMCRVQPRQPTWPDMSVTRYHIESAESNIVWHWGVFFIDWWKQGLLFAPHNSEWKAWTLLSPWSTEVGDARQETCRGARSITGAQGHNLEITTHWHAAQCGSILNPN